MKLTKSALATAVLAAASFSCLAADYSFVPRQLDGGDGTTVISCRTPSGWSGWKDDPSSWKLFRPGDRRLVEGERTVRVSFSLLNCRGASCPELSLDTAARASPGPPDIKAAVGNTARELVDTTARVTKVGSFDAGRFGRATIWKVHRSTDHNFMTVLSDRDVQAIVSLSGPDSGRTLQHLDSLKELARSVRITKGTFTAADMIHINIHQPDAAIRAQLLQLTPFGSAKDDVFRFLDRRLLKDPYRADTTGLYRRGNDFEVDLGSYNGPLNVGQSRHMESTPFAGITVVKAVWRFALDQRLRDIEIRRVVERR